MFIPRSSDAYISFRCTGTLKFIYPLKSLVLGTTCQSDNFDGDGGGDDDDDDDGGDNNKDVFF